MTINPDEWVQQLRAIAKLSPCQKVKRSAVLITNLGVMCGEGFNGLPGKIPCDGRCLQSCGTLAMHAEARALAHSAVRIMMVTQNGGYVDVIHARFDNNGTLQAGRGPRCIECCKAMLDAGVRNLWLFMDDPRGEDPDNCIWTPFPMEYAYKTASAGKWTTEEQKP